MADPGTELASLDFGNLIGGPLVAVITAQSIAARATADFIKTVGFYPEGTKSSTGTDIGNTPVYVAFKYPKEIQPYQPGKTYYKVSSVTIDNGGSGYTAAPNVTFSPANGVGEVQAIGTTTMLAASGVVSSVTVTNAGKYLTPPTVTIVAPGGAGNTTATATAVMTIDHVEAGLPAVFQEMKIEVPVLTIFPIPFIKIDTFTLDFNAKITSMETKTEATDLAISGSLEVRQRWPGGAAKLNVSCAFKKSTSSGSSVERTYSMAIHVQASQDEMPAGMEKLLNILEGAMKSTPVV